MKPFKSLLLFALSVPIIATHAVANESGTEKTFDLIAEATSASSTCKALGYDIDNDGLIAFIEDERAQAIKDGMSERQIDLALDEKLRLKFKRLNGAWTRAAIMDHSLENVQRHNIRLKKQCQKLSENERIGQFFVKAAD